MPEVEPPAVRLLAGVLAREAIQPALDPAGEREVGSVEGQDATESRVVA